MPANAASRRLVSRNPLFDGGRAAGLSSSNATGNHFLVGIRDLRLKPLSFALYGVAHGRGGKAVRLGGA